MDDDRAYLDPRPCDQLGRNAQESVYPLLHTQRRIHRLGFAGSSKLACLGQ